jgi:hypothetical protein
MIEPGGFIANNPALALPCTAATLIVPEVGDASSTSASGRTNTTIPTPKVGNQLLILRTKPEPGGSGAMNFIAAIPQIKAISHVKPDMSTAQAHLDR